MDELDASQIDAVLAMLKEHGVEKFEGLGFAVTFGAGAYQSKDTQKSDREPSKPPKSNWENEALWPGGEIPAFPTSKRTK